MKGQLNRKEPGCELWIEEVTADKAHQIAPTLQPRLSGLPDWLRGGDRMAVQDSANSKDSDYPDFVPKAVCQINGFFEKDPSVLAVRDKCLGTTC